MAVIFVSVENQEVVRRRAHLSGHYLKKLLAPGLNELLVTPVVKETRIMESSRSRRIVGKTISPFLIMMLKRQPPRSSCVPLDLSLVRGAEIPIAWRPTHLRQPGIG